MRHGIFSRTGMLAVVAIGAAALALSATAFAGSPSLGAGCGAGASIAGSDTAGKFTLGSNSGVCVLTLFHRVCKPAGLHGDERNQRRGTCGGRRPEDFSDPAHGGRALGRWRHDSLHLRGLLTPDPLRPGSARVAYP